MLQEFPESFTSWIIRRLRPFVVLVRAPCICMQVQSNGRMALTGKIRITRRKTCLSAILSTINITVTGLGSTPGLRFVRLATNRLSHGAAIRIHINLNYTKIYPVPRSKHSVSVTNTSQLMLYREIIAVCSHIHTKHINTLCGQNVEFR
jgi:hypothetical protein